MSPPTKDDLSLSVLFPNEFLKSEDLKGQQWVVTISGVSREMVPMNGGKKERATILRLEKTPKKIICNKTNGYSLALLLSPDLSAPSGRDWVGKRITLCSDIDTRSGEEVAAIRIATSPDATPERASIYAQAWRGKRKGGDLVRRIKRTVALMAIRGGVPPVDEPEQARETADVGPAPRDEEDMFRQNEESA